MRIRGSHFDQEEEHEKKKSYRQLSVQKWSVATYQGRFSFISSVSLALDLDAGSSSDAFSVRVASANTALNLLVVEQEEVGSFQVHRVFWRNVFFHFERLSKLKKFEEKFHTWMIIDNNNHKNKS